MTNSNSASTVRNLGSYEVVPMTADHLPQALALSQAVQWPYRLEDWQVAFGLGHGFAAEQGGELVGTLLWWPYEPDYASTGMIIVADKAQRQGIGARLMDALLADAGGRKMILNSTVEGRALYTRYGFKPCGMVFQYQGVLNSAPAVDATAPLREATPQDRDAILAVDGAGSGMGRANLVDAMLGGGDALVVDRGDGISGYAVVRRWGRGVVIGPVVARDEPDAKSLIAALAARHVGTFVRVDVTESCGIGPWVETLGLPQVGRVVAMSRGEPPKADGQATLFALSNQSLG